MDARYRFTVRFRIESSEGTWVDPATFETAFYRAAPRPGEEGWLFFRDHLWRGEANDPEHLGSLIEDDLGVSVEAVSFGAFETDREYLDALEGAIADDLDAFRADSVEEVRSKYLGSAIEVREGDPEGV